MFDVPFYIAEEYFYKNRVYRGRFPISIIDTSCDVPVFKPRTELLQELDEGDYTYGLLRGESTDSNPSYVLTQTENPKLQKNLDGKIISPTPVV
jgi:hypothetical protein